MAWTLCNLAMIALNLGDWAEAKAYIEECFSLFQELGSKYGQATCLLLFWASRTDWMVITSKRRVSSNRRWSWRARLGQSGWVQTR